MAPFFFFLNLQKIVDLTRLLEFTTGKFSPGLAFLGSDIMILIFWFSYELQEIQSKSTLESEKLFKPEHGTLWPLGVERTLCL